MNPACLGNTAGDVIRAGNPQVFEFLAVEFDPFGAHDLLEEQPADVVADDETVRLGLQVHEIGVNDAAGAGHVLDDDGGVAGNMLAQVARDGARVGVETAARRERNDQADRLAFVEAVVT
ncbi:MAG: hypothetical protein HYU31_21010 [Deltaproteobacteria bacterium]|nr:hypothetical protein [Deltaproteobacteria bacterium]